MQTAQAGELGVGLWRGYGQRPQLHPDKLSRQQRLGRPSPDRLAVLGLQVDQVLSASHSRFAFFFCLWSVESVSHPSRHPGLHIPLSEGWRWSCGCGLWTWAGQGEQAHFKASESCELQVQCIRREGSWGYSERENESLGHPWVLQPCLPWHPPPCLHLGKSCFCSASCVN